jgi:NADP-dependent 3-hydroxy acid dehydrogenase YdfG
MKRFERKVVLVTGASSGLGEALAARREDKGSEVLRRIEALRWAAKVFSSGPTSHGEMMWRRWSNARWAGSAVSIAP